MAGAGYKLFTTGEVLTAAQVNTYLQEQTVMSFADSAARTSALSGVLAEGMMSYLRDTNAVEVYNGSAWVSVGGSSPLTTKGDIYGFSTVDARIPIGTNNQVLTADSTQALGLKWAAVPSAAKSYSLISTTALSGSTTTVTGLSGYDNFIFLIDGGSTNSTQSEITLKLNADGGSNKYISAGLLISGDASYTAAISSQLWNSFSALSLGYTSSAAAGIFTLGMNLFGGNSTGGKAFQYSCGFSKSTGGDQISQIMSGVYKGTAVISSISIISSVGTFDAGNLIIYGAA